MVIFVGPLCFTVVNIFLTALPLDVVGLPLGTRTEDGGTVFVVVVILLGTTLELERVIVGLVLSPTKCLVGKRPGLDDEASSGLDGTLLAVVLILGLAGILAGTVAMPTTVDLPGPVFAVLGA